MEKAIHRFVRYLKEKEIPLSNADVKLKAGNGYIGKTLKNEGTMNSDIIGKIIGSFPDLSPVWLLTGKGEMFLNKERIADNASRNSDKETIKSLKTIIEGREAEVSLCKQRTNKLEEQILSLGHKPVE